ncbi:MAG: acyl-CoA thioesterase [Patescibacteria group bacterium]
MDDQRQVSSTKREDVEMVMPHHLNTLGTLFGGWLPVWFDLACAKTARLHSGLTCATVVFDAIEFYEPVFAGELVIIKSQINRVWNTSCEIGVKAFALAPDTDEKRFITSTFLTFVSLDKNLKPIPMRKVFPETGEERIYFEEADVRRRLRKNRARGV